MPVLARRYFLDARVRTIAFAYAFAVYAYIQPQGYHSAYPTEADRMAFAHSFAGNDALRLFYGYPYDVLTIDGYTAWRVGGTLAVLAAVFGVFAAVRVFRTEEEAGRAELVLAGTLGRRVMFASAVAAVSAGVALLWLAEFLGFAVAGLPVAGSAYLALSTVSVIPVFFGLTAVVCQFAPSRRSAVTGGVLALVLFWALRVVADTAPGVRWLQWASPLGWAELMRPFTGSSPAALGPAFGATAILLVIASRLAAGRDVGTGIVALRDEGEPRVHLLSSPLAFGLRSETGALVAWYGGLAAVALLFGMIASSVSTAGISAKMQKEIAKLGSGSIATPAGYLAFVFIIFVLAVCLFACSQIGGARNEESAGQVETTLALPVGRVAWLGGRVVLTVVAAGGLGLVAGALTWAGAETQGVHMSFARMLEAGSNCLPAAILFAGLATLALGAVPRASTALSYGLVTAAFLWYMVAALLGLPKWVVGLTPFQHIGLVPVQPYRVGAAVVMSGLGVAATAGGLWLFRRRDVIGV